MSGNGSTPSPTPRIQYRPLVAAPELQQDWHDEQEERNVTWPELFFDLFFVAAISNLGHLFEKRPDAPNAGRIVLYHAMLFFLWADYATLRTRYRLQGLLFRCIGLTLQLGVLGFLIGVRNDAEWYHLLAGGYALARFATAVVFGIIAVTIPRARVISLVHLVFDALMIAAAACAAVFRESYQTYFVIVIGIAVAEAIDPLVPSLVFRQYDIPLHVEHMSERLGQLIMLHLGEAVIGFASSPLENTVPQFAAVALAAVLVWCLHLCYYHIEPDQHDHAYRQSRVRGLLFFYCHWPLAISFLLTGTGLRLMLGTYPRPDGGTSVTVTHMGSGRTDLGPSTAPAAAAAALERTPGSLWRGLLAAQGQEHLEPKAPLDIAILLCVSYAASLHFLAVIRAAHYFSLDPHHRIVRHQERKGVKHWWNAWWAMLWLWPVPVYFVPLMMQGPAAHNLLHPSFQAIGANVVTNCHHGLHSTHGKTSNLPWGTELIPMHESLQSGPGLDGHLLGMSDLGSWDCNRESPENTGLSSTVLLALLACHAVVLTLAESLFANMITKTPIARGLASHEDGDAGGPDDVAPAGHIPAEA